MLQLQKAKLLPFLTHLELGTETVTATADPHLVMTLRARTDEFKEGLLYGLHHDVGDHLTDFRGFRGQFGTGSLQMVIDTETWRFYADVDRYNVYEDAIGSIGHSVEVLTHWFKRWFA